VVVGDDMVDGEMSWWWYEMVDEQTIDWWMDWKCRWCHDLDQTRKREIDKM